MAVGLGSGKGELGGGGLLDGGGSLTGAGTIGGSGEPSPGGSGLGSGGGALLGVEVVLKNTAPALIELSVGGTSRYKLKSRQEVEQINVSSANQSIEVALDPSYPSRVIIRGITTGDSQIELTDANGAKEKVNVRVK